MLKAANKNVCTLHTFERIAMISISHLLRLQLVLAPRTLVSMHRSIRMANSDRQVLALI